MDQFTVYGLIDPRDDSVFYIGYTKHLSARISGHRAVDWGCSAAFRCRDIKNEGKRVGYKVFGTYDDKTVARWHERNLILSMTGLVNKTQNAVLTVFSCPPELGIEYATGGDL